MKTTAWVPIATVVLLLVSTLAVPSLAIEYELIGPDGASDLDSNDVFSETVRSVRDTRWEVTMSLGKAFPQDHHGLSSELSHAILGQAEFDEEFLENGIASPGSGQSLISGEMKSSMEIELDALRRLSQQFSVGLEWGLKTQQDLGNLQKGAYNQPFFDLEYRSSIYHVVPLVQWGPWIGPLRPYIGAGVGLYNVYEKMTLTVTDVDDPGFPEQTVLDRSKNFAGGLFMGGLTCRIPGGFTLGGEVRYQKVFAPRGGYIFVTPSVVLAYYF